MIISNAGYGLFGAAEELTDAQVEHIVATNLTGPIQLIRAALPHLRAQGGGRIIQISSYGGQVAFPGISLYHATKWGIEGFVESVAQEVASFGIGMTLVEPGGARTEFRYGSAQVATLMPIYDETRPTASCDADPTNGLAVGDPARMAAAHHRERRHRAGTAAHRARLTGAGKHPNHAAQADRRLRAQRRARRVHRLSRPESDAMAISDTARKNHDELFPGQSRP